MRGFLITDPFRRTTLYSGKAPSRVTPEIVAEAFTAFSSAIEDAGCFLFDFDRFWSGRYKERIRLYFEKVYQEAYHPLRCMWDDIQQIRNWICLGDSEKEFLGYDPCPECIGDLNGSTPGSLTYMISQGLEKGSPLVRVLYEDRRPGRESEEYKRLDAFFLIRHLLRFHIHRLFGRIDTTSYAVCLARKLDGTVDPTCLPKGKEWNRQLLDRNFNGLVAADPVTRGRYMLDRVVIMKTLWDISTNLRARRMREILRVVWPELPEQSSDTE